MHRGHPHKYCRQLLAVSLGYLSHYCFITVLVGVGNSSCFSNKEEVVTGGWFKTEAATAGISVAGTGSEAQAFADVLSLSRGCCPQTGKGRVHGFKATFVFIANN